ncbi:unnamed protein product (mitochondrion) [Plasmodiophora brassicae]|uniref:Ribosomal L1 domain-containing protein 1 n=1 Tax=Plasmodiophora brassicae TaxID=37360 RepID=A0A0G4IT81_PLABS|nr:hypothetical protein PBRA_006468 [Plasmodiophora brassicae]SPQ94440.1 unnamed protein product [Plasmodiophora brassicae]
MVGRTDNDGASPVESGTVERAVGALQKYVAKKEAESAQMSLVDDDQFYILVLNLFSAPSKAKTSPKRIQIPHSLYLADGVEICLITKDPQKEYKEKLALNPVRNVRKVIGVQKLKAKYSQYKDKRELCLAYDLFLADQRVLNLLPHLLGKAFFTRKKQPVPVRINGKNVASELEKARDSTYMFLSCGSCVAIKIARVSQTRTEIIQNIMQGLDSAVKQIRGNWDNIQSVHLKLAESVALPLYNCLPAEPTT